MKLKTLIGVFCKVVFSAVFAGVFYVGWMAVALPIFKSGMENKTLITIIWIAAPFATALGFTTSIFLYERLFKAGKSKFSDVFRVSFAGCAIGAGVLVYFGSMLIVFGMFALGTIAVAVREILVIRKAEKTNKSKIKNRQS